MRVARGLVWKKGIDGSGEGLRQDAEVERGLSALYTSMKLFKLRTPNTTTIYPCTCISVNLSLCICVFV